jgi:hypothetical protein
MPRFYIFDPPQRPLVGQFAQSAAGLCGLLASSLISRVTMSEPYGVRATGGISLSRWHPNQVQARITPKLTKIHIFNAKKSAGAVRLGLLRLCFPLCSKDKSGRPCVMPARRSGRDCRIRCG